MYLLDTDTCIFYLKQNQAVRDRIAKAGAGKIHVCTYTISELFYGAYKSEHVESNANHVRNLCDVISLVSANQNSSEIFGRVKAGLSRRGELIDDFDIGIASIAISKGLILVTNNTKHFERIPDLNLENWLEVSSNTDSTGN